MTRSELTWIAESVLRLAFTSNAITPYLFAVSQQSLRRLSIISVHINTAAEVNCERTVFSVLQIMGEQKGKKWNAEGLFDVWQGDKDPDISC